MLPGDVFTTRACPANTFSDAEWQSEEKARNVNHYNDELKSAEEGLAREKSGEESGEDPSGKERSGLYLRS